MTEFVLKLSCPDRTGIVAAVSAFVAERSGLITETAHFVDTCSNRSFMRTTFKSDALPGIDVLNNEFAAVAEAFRMEWGLHQAGRRCRTLLAVSNQGHCLNSLLHRWSIGTLPLDIAGIVSNHDTHARLADWYGLPYHHYAIESGRKHEQEARILDLFAATGADLLVLARYMQILSNETCRALAGRCINIHHSFLPSFKGARPYTQAYQRGVKIIGATAHYVTEDLDEGPIIEQAVERVGHEHTPERFQEIGRDLEAIVLARAVRWHAERRILLDGQRSVILS